MKFLYYLLFLFVCFPAFSQNTNLTAIERAYFFHVVKKSPILNDNIGRYFDYVGPKILFPNKDINYDSTETLIINHPEYLTIYRDEIRKSPVGLIAELANKTALWELNKALLAKRMEDQQEMQIYGTHYALFEQILTSNLPVNAFKEQNGERIIQPKIFQLLNPTLDLNQKVKMIGAFHFLTSNDQLETLRAINRSVENYVQLRSKDLFEQLGGESTRFDNLLIAVGDGSTTDGLLSEREKDEKGRWNRGLPKAVGLFPYQLSMNPDYGSTKKAPLIKTARITNNGFMENGNGKITNLHFDVWGYNSEKQTTVVIEKNGKTYHLFGSVKTRFLSPDSAFSKGKTFQYILDGLQARINNIEEKISGKKGYDYWISYYEKKVHEFKGDVFAAGQGVNNSHAYTVYTNEKKSKWKKKNDYNYDINGIKTYSNQTKRSKKQNDFIASNDALSDAQAKLKALKKEKEEAKYKLSLLQQQLELDRDAFGRNWIPYTVNDGLYTFADSATFDVLTQEFQFPPSKDTIPFEVRLIAIPDAVMASKVDEVMMHLNITEVVPGYNARVQLRLNDFFASNKWKIPHELLQPNDSISTRVFLEQLAKPNAELKLLLRGNGNGKWDGEKTVFQYQQNDIPSYPTSKEDSTYKRLRTSTVNIFVNHGIRLEINSFTDPVQTKFEILNKTIAEARTKYHLTNNQILSGYRTAAILFKLQDELNVKAGKMFDRATAKIIIDRLNEAINKSKILIGQVSLKAEIFR